MKKKELEMRLQRVPGLESPRADLEQYSTPAWIVADILHIALSLGHIEGRAVLDLGTGNGIFGIGASLLGARRVISVDIDPEALRQARRNAEAMGADIELVRGDAHHLNVQVDTVIQNPPFGAQRRGADRPFLTTALACGEIVYSLHMEETAGFLKDFLEGMNAEVFLEKTYKFKIPHMFPFHTRAKKEVDVLLLGIRKTGETR